MSVSNRHERHPEVGISIRPHDPDGPRSRGRSTQVPPPVTVRCVVSDLGGGDVAAPGFHEFAAAF